MVHEIIRNSNNKKAVENQRNLEFHRFYWVIEEKKEKHVPV